MALRPMGVYLLTGTALHSQTRTTYHLAKMNELAAESASLALLADAEISSAIELQGKSAIDSEAGLTLQSESIELETAAEREFVKAAAETALGDEYLEQAEALHEKSAQDALESEELITDAEELQLRSEELHVQAEYDRAAAALDEERSVALLEEAAKAGEIATGAEEKAAEYQALAVKRGGQSAKDGKALLRTEAGAMEDAEVIAACTPIPFLNFVCDAIGAIIESGYQSIAAFEGAKSAIETISAVTAQRKEHAELVVAIEKEEEAARLVFEAEKFQGLANEENGKSAVEEAEGDAAGLEAGEAQLLSEEKAVASEREEALATLDEEKAAEEYAKAARDESIALEEESSAIASQIESEELLEESTSEEFESLTARFDGESKEEKAGNIMKQSIGHGVSALGLVLHAVVTACLVVYIVVMRGLMKMVVPGVARVFMSESSLNTAHAVERVCRFTLHVGVVIGTIASMSSLVTSFENMPTPLRTRSLIYMAVVAGVIESLGFHSTHAACCCHTNKMDLGAAITTTLRAFFSNIIHLVPLVMIELLILTTIFGPGIFEQTRFRVNPVWMWCTLLLLVGIFIRSLTSISVTTKPVSDQISMDDGEQEFLCASVGERSMHPPCDIEKEYGSMEDVSILSSNSTTNGNDSRAIKASSRSRGTLEYDTNTTNFIQKCKKAFHQYCERLRPSSDLLALSLVAMLLWHCWPLLRVLYPLAKTSLGSIASWVSVPILVFVTFIAAVMIHFTFVH
mmetsp:Transcript_13527/g.29050  ORF Transcript_13527/g.29050 Transcript_13527/m.29050 type:complete len:746 (+) Transcript_13527:361-2598(+)